MNDKALLWLQALMNQALNGSVPNDELLRVLVQTQPKGISFADLTPIPREAEIRDLLRDGKFIAGVKLYRESVANSTLREAKEACDRIIAEMVARGERPAVIPNP